MHVSLRLGDEDHEMYLVRENGTVKVEVDGDVFECRIVEELPDGVEVEVKGTRFVVEMTRDDLVRVNGESLQVHVADFRTGGAPGAHDGRSGSRGARVKPPMPGKIVSVKVKEGEAVEAGRILIVLEAMKMQNELPAPVSGTVKAIHVKPGQAVEAKDILIELE
ncbi:MAG: biotin/lipoyl-containing protein [Thermoplasmatota archaeon]